jgi:hypothetical protein
MCNRISFYTVASRLPDRSEDGGYEESLVQLYVFIISELQRVWRLSVVLIVIVVSQQLFRAAFGSWNAIAVYATAVRQRLRNVKRLLLVPAARCIMTSCDDLNYWNIQEVNE